MTESTTVNRDESGRFVKGNQAASGHKNKMAKKRQALTDEFLKQCTPARWKRIVKKLLDLAEGGDLQAIKEVNDRLLGRPKMIDEPEEPINITLKLPDDLKDL